MWTVFLGATPAILNVVMAYLIRSEEATLHASIGTMSGCLLNIVLDPIFILIFKMGAQGAALATMLSNMFALMYFFGYLLIQKNKTVVCISIRQLSFRKDIVMGICAVGIPASIQNLLNVVSQMVLNNLAALYGTAAVAAMGIAAKVSLIPCQIAMGISQGVMPLIGYAFASKNVERMKGVLRFTMLVAMSLLVIMTIGYELFPQHDHFRVYRQCRNDRVRNDLFASSCFVAAVSGAGFHWCGRFSSDRKREDFLVHGFGEKSVVRDPFDVRAQFSVWILRPGILPAWRGSVHGNDRHNMPGAFSSSVRAGASLIFE